MTGASIDVGPVIFYHLMQSVQFVAGSIGFPSLIIGICALFRLTWATNEEMCATMRPIDAGLMVEFLGYVPPTTKHRLSTTGSSSSSSIPRVQTVHTRLDHMERVLDPNS